LTVDEVGDRCDALTVSQVRLIKPSLFNPQDGAYDTPERVMKAAQRMAAQLLAAEPGIRDFVRREFMASAVVTTGASFGPHTSHTW